MAGRPILSSKPRYSQRSFWEYSTRLMDTRSSCAEPMVCVLATYH